MQRRKRRIKDIVPLDAPQGAGVFCRLADGRYLFALYDESQVGGEHLVVGRIGGGRKPEETWEQCVLREVMEETGSRAVVQSSEVCFYADLDGRAEDIGVEADPRPVLISCQPPSFGSIPGGVYYNLVFWARLLDEPKPGPELDALVILDERLLRKLGRNSLALRELQQAGAEVVPARELDPDAPVTLGRSVEVLLAILDRTR
ncbi:MAG: NUDIX hydrolase [Armatimonadota bacterium]|nr:MAG: NUDIX hydrolase [Armatimonadota bacterium]